MSIEEWSDEQLVNLENNYLEKGLTEGGKYTLFEVRAEKLRRMGAHHSGQEVIRHILLMAREADDGRVTYGDLWDNMCPNTPRAGAGFPAQIARYLYAASYYCWKHKLPAITSLVVRSDTRQINDEGVANICSFWSELGVTVGHVPRDWVDEQTQLSLALNEDQLV